MNANFHTCFFSTRFIVAVVTCNCIMFQFTLINVSAGQN